MSGCSLSQRFRAPAGQAGVAQRGTGRTASPSPSGSGAPGLWPPPRSIRVQRAAAGRATRARPHRDDPFAPPNQSRRAPQNSLYEGQAHCSELSDACSMILWRSRMASSVATHMMSAQRTTRSLTRAPEPRTASPDRCLSATRGARVLRAGDRGRRPVAHREAEQVVRIHDADEVRRVGGHDDLDPHGVRERPVNGLDRLRMDAVLRFFDEVDAVGVGCEGDERERDDAEGPLGEAPGRQLEAALVGELEIEVPVVRSLADVHGRDVGQRLPEVLGPLLMKIGRALPRVSELPPGPGSSGSSTAAWRPPARRRSSKRC
jgi:hypothetical protein